MPVKTEVFGNYMEMNLNQEHMALQFKAAKLNIDEPWESGALSASFLSRFGENSFLQKIRNPKFK